MYNIELEYIVQQTNRWKVPLIVYFDDKSGRNLVFLPIDIYYKRMYSNMQGKHVKNKEISEGFGGVKRHLGRELWILHVPER